MATFGKQPWVAPGEQMAAAAAANGNSLIPNVSGRLIRVSSGSQIWDLSKEWRGREIADFVIKKSLWTKGYTVLFYIETSSGMPNRLHTFTLWLDEALPREDVESAAMAYMMALNMRRIE